MLRDAVHALGRAELLARPGPEAWSTLEVVGHLADTEALYAERMKRILAEDHPTLLYADETRWVERLASHERDVDEELLLIEITRKQLARILRAVVGLAPAPRRPQQIGNTER